MPVTVIGSIHMDFYIKLPKLPQAGETVIGSGFTMLPGGKGANQAVASAKLGMKTFMVSRVGNDVFGEKLLKNLEKYGVDIKYVRVDPTTHTGIAFILLDETSGENMIAVAPGTDMRVSRKDVDEAIDAISQSNILLMQLEIPLDIVVYASRKAYEEGVKVILNPAPAAVLPEDLYKYIYVITPNRVEAELLTGVSIRELSDVEKAGRILLERGVEYVVITLGAEGSLLISRDFTEHIPAFKTKVVDTTGAGDAFNAALAVSLAEGYDLREACIRANAAAAIKVSKLGAQSGLPTRDELEDFIKRKM